MKVDRIINGETVEQLKKLPDESVDLIFADPPYWMRTNGVLKRVEGTDFNGVYESWDKFQSLEDYEAFTEEWLRECKRVLKRNGSFWVICGMQCIFTIGSIMQKLDFWLINDIIWQKSNPTPNFRGTRFNNSHETLIWATKSKKAKYTFNYKTMKEMNTDTVSFDDFEKGIRKQMGSIWKMPVSSGNERIKDDDGNKLHSTQKPETLLRRVIAATSKPGDIILDPFGGTMTTGAVAKKMGRKYIMIEKEAKYCQYGEKRLENISQHITPIERAEFDEKPLKVTMPEMIRNHFFEIGEKFYLKKSEELIAYLNENGKLNVKGELINMHTAAAQIGSYKSDRVNGFDYWYVKRNDEFKSIKEIREEYRDYKKNKQ